MRFFAKQEITLFDKVRVMGRLNLGLLPPQLHRHQRVPKKYLRNLGPNNISFFLYTIIPS